MKIFFIIPPSIHYIEPYAYEKADKENTVRPSLGLLYVAAALQQSTGIKARVIDCNATGTSLDELERIISQEQPEIIGFSVLTFNLLNCLEVCKIIRRCSPKTKICFGGWHPTLYPEETLGLAPVDFIVIGEGEQTFVELVSLFMDNEASIDVGLSQINGLGYKTAGGEIHINPPRELINNLDDIPFPAYDLIDTSKYSNLLACTGNFINIMTSRGCPHRCVFCDMRKSKYRFRSPANIIEEIKLWVARGVREFFIQDDNFTISRKRTLEFCRLLIDADLKIKYKISSRVDCLDEELVSYLKKSGCYRIYFGVESGSQEVLDYLQKGIKVEQIINAFQVAKKHGIDRCAYIMIGIPNETREDMDKTLRLIKKIKPDHLHCSICTPMPRTYLYDKLLTEGLISNDYWREFAVQPNPAFKTPFISNHLTDLELREMQDKIQRRFYLNPMVIVREIIKTRGIKQFVAKAKMALRMYFK